MSVIASDGRGDETVGAGNLKVFSESCRRRNATIVHYCPSDAALIKQSFLLDMFALAFRRVLSLVGNEHMLTRRDGDNYRSKSTVVPA